MSNAVSNAMGMASRFHPDRDPLRPPPAPGLGRGFSLAVAAHVLLVVALSFGVSWRSTPVPALEAELWSAVPQAAAPKEQLPTTPQPEPPKPQPEPPRPQQPTPQEVQAQRDADIAIAKAKERKLKEEQEQREADDKRKQEQLRKKEEAEQKERDRKAKEEQAKKDEAKDKLDKAKADKARKDAEARAEAQRQENLRRIQGMAGASGGPTSTGTALKSSGPSANYAGRIKARVRPNIIYSDPGGAANPEAEVEVRAGPDGTIIARKVVRSSGLPDFDNAVLRALDKTEKFPPDTDGRVPSVMIITFRPRE
ncbi:cell envelope integrity protein TolA [Mitsuaria sp. GD03876]|uniref:cell envelope integrity protein TolA n=1 Tax=Mitsuaria sp. GD03876 TaxID=2975399 RepID=UPI00244AA38F|nr:cell envelope integrity protein TolA [Mitsuaria sp. GD03876]MDH0866698.1 cell envelope integrity protein TolA [Mitsuaria sp. GD03876]